MARPIEFRGNWLPIAASLAALYAVPAAAQAPVAAAGYHVHVFAASTSYTAPDSIVATGTNVWVGYGNNAAPDGSRGHSDIVEYDLNGALVRDLKFGGHNDGLRLDPVSQHLWVLQNEDAKPRLIILDPATGMVLRQTPLMPVNGGGYDDAAFIDNRIYVSASNPALDAQGVNEYPAIVSLSHSISGFVPETILDGNSLAVDVLTGQSVQLNLTDPDSLTVMPNGNLLMDDQGDAQLIELQFTPGKRPFARQIPLAGGVQVDDTVFPSVRHGTLYVSDTPANTVYAVTSKDFRVNTPYTASTGVAATPSSPAVPAFVGELSLYTGATTPLVTGLMAPHGMAFQPAG